MGGCCSDEEPRTRQYAATHNPYAQPAPPPAGPPPPGNPYAAQANPYQQQAPPVAPPVAAPAGPPVAAPVGGYGAPPAGRVAHMRVPGIGEPLANAPVGQPAPRPTGRKRALLIGINYYGTEAALRGCINDVKRMQQMLQSQGWSHSEMRIMTDDGRSTQPTKANIVAGMRWLADGVQPGDLMFLHYSGHGAQQEDPHHLEEDGMNETLIPVDFKRAGMISDDDIFEMLVRPLPIGARLTAVMDCCHSGTGLDLPLTWNMHTNSWQEDTNPWHSLGDVMLFSGCDDDQCSADASDSYSRPAGAMTTAFCDAIEQDRGTTIANLLVKMHRQLVRKGFDQKPRLTSSQPFDARQRRFDLVDICSNLNQQVGRLVRHAGFKAKPRPASGKLGNMLGAAGLLAGGVVVAAVAAPVVADLAGDLLGAFF